MQACSDNMAQDDLHLTTAHERPRFQPLKCAPKQPELRQRAAGTRPRTSQVAPHGLAGRIRYLMHAEAGYFELRKVRPRQLATADFETPITVMLSQYGSSAQ